MNLQTRLQSETQRGLPVVTGRPEQVTEETKKGKVVGKLDPPPNFESTGSTPAIIGG